MKGLILCAGRGTRLHPFSYSQPKTLLPVANHPVLHYCIRKLIEVGIRDIGIVINPTQTQIVEYVGDGSRYQATITFIEQTKPLGIAHAVKIARPFIQEEPFLLLLGDNLLMDSLHQLHQTFLAASAEGALLLGEVDRPQDYGIAEICDGRIVSLEEKPVAPKSRLAVIGAYVFTPAIFEVIHTLKPSGRGEYEITHAIQGLVDKGYPVAHTVTDGLYSDVGTIERWFEANRWMLAEEVGDRVKAGTTSVLRNCECIGPVLIGEHCRLENCRIGPYVSIQDGVEVKNCRWIRESILLENSSLIDVEWIVEDSVFGRSSHLIGLHTSKTGVFIVSDKSTILFPTEQKKAGT
ncbi:glucose-1-phosphate thymidylyltransferase [Brevibacillus sp. SYP-B805]|uniref:glucose-1-phosphate thymidylyltransferase n=1 Tax=Brevibacillus sp. SYP-B805 TaxID=1578199 RepID=UPI0013ED0173|nr:glucose-1-phosphate thymidylyltransferase [Brevibacillus sp. SYP-B805]NGQ97307.1 glucose-1-phosphate thymidylyltransferase [Brevibacillus sp. SYP-B805]